ncbi:MmcQ/YjbR family DNA-binding protein [Nocardiopsis sp. NPDC058631]|uniref:MmcQ/YjbR family DNA-binding protein n=1 Tax=Nocardiopsis sp. NPDC058631 TaxID=3346566 RepID=UPI003665BE53
MGVEIERFLPLVRALPECEYTESDRYTTFRVRGRPFGYLWPDTATVGLKQTLLEQTALVAERPEVFEVQFTAGGFGWVVVHLDGIDLEELSELTLEAWYLTAPEELLTTPPTPAALIEA